MTERPTSEDGVSDSDAGESDEEWSLEKKISK